MRAMLSAVSWDGGAGTLNWQDAANWSGNVLPGASDDVTIDVPGNITITHNSTTDTIKSLSCQENLVLSGGTLTINGTSTVNGNLTLSGATLNTTSAITLNGNTTWSSGTINATGAGLTTTGAMSITGSTSVYLQGILNNSGVITQTTTANVLFNGATLNNLVGGTFDLQSGYFYNQSGTNAFSNAGTFRRSVGNGTVTVGVAFNNLGGSIDLQAGTVSLTGGGASTGGTYAVAAGTVLNYGGGTQTWNGSYTFSGAGTVGFSTGTISIGGGSATFNNTGGFQVTAGTLTGSGTLGGNVGWSSGTINATGAGLTTTGAMSITGSTSVYLQGILNNSGVITQTTTANVLFNGATLNNLVGGTFDLQSGYFYNQSGTNAFSNAGTFRTSAGSGTVTIPIRFNNLGGTIDVQAGTVNLTGGGASTGGTYAVATGTVLNYGGGTHTWSGSYTVSGAGTVLLSGGTLDGATLNGNFTVTDNTSVTVKDGLTLNGTLTLGSLSSSVYGSLNFVGSQTLGGTGTVIFGQYGSYDALWVTTAGTTLTIGSGITVRGQNGYVGYVPTFGGTTNVAVINQGTIQADVSGGTITVNGTGDQNIGSLSAINGATLSIQGALTNIGTLSVDATSSLSFNNALIGGSINVTPGGKVSGGGGTLDGVTVNGNITITDNTNVTVKDGLTLYGTLTLGSLSSNVFGRLNFVGSQTLGGTGTVVFGQYASYNALSVTTAGTTLTIGSEITVRGQNGYVGYVPGIGVTTNVAVINQGTIKADVSGGTITVNGTGDQNNGSLSAINGATLSLQGDGWQDRGINYADATSKFSIAGSFGSNGNNIAFTGSGTFTSTATIQGTTISVPAGCVFNVSGTLDGVTVNGNFTVTGNTSVTVKDGLTLNGTLTLGSLSTNVYGYLNFVGSQTLGGTGTVIFGQSTSNNDLWVSTAGTTLTIGSGITVRGQNGIVGYDSRFGFGYSNNVAVVNLGTIQADVSGGTITVNGTGHQNTGSLAAINGATISIGGALTNLATLSVDATSSLFFNNALIGGTVNVTPGGTVTGGGGTLDGVTINGSFSVTGNTSVTVKDGLTLNGTLTLGAVSSNVYGYLNFVGSQTMGGTGTVVFGQSTINNELVVSTAGTTLTIGSGITVRGQNGYVGYVPGFGGSANVTVVNLGTIQADVSGGTITVNGTGDQNIGSLAAINGATLSIQGALTNTRTLRITGTSNLSLQGVLNNSGVITQATTANASFIGGTLNNLVDGTFDLQNGNLNNSAGTNAFNNAGLFRKSAGAGTVNVGVAFNNLGGSIEVQAGTVNLTGGGASTGGTYAVAAGTVLNHGGGTQSWSGSYTVSGAGTVGLSAGTLSIGAGSTATFNNPGGFQVAGGTLTGSGTLGGNVGWSSGTINATGAGLTTTGAMSISGSSTLTLQGVLNNSGVITQTTTGQVYFSGGTLNNLAGGTFDLQSGNLNNSSGTNAFNNSGTLRKSTGTGTITVGVAFNNLGGSIDVRAGTVSLTSFGGSSTGGTLNAANSATLLLGGTLTGNYVGSPAGFVGLAGVTLQVGAAGASLNFGGNGFTLSGGALNGGSAGLTNTGILNITGASNLTLQGILNNTGVITQTTTASLLFIGGTLNNLAGGTFDLQSGGLNSSSGTNAFNNSGILRKSTGTGTINVGVAFNNLGGSIDVRAGTVSLTSFGGSSTGGTLNAANSATLLLGGTLTGNYVGSPAGFVGLAGVTLQVGAAGASLNFGGNGFTLSGGALNGGSAGLTNTGILNITGASNLTLQGILNNTGVITQTTTASLLFIGGTLNNLAGGTFDLQSGGLNSSSGTNAFNNSGILRKSTGTGTINVGVAFNNLGGSIDVRAGTVSLTSFGGSSTGGTLNAANSATLLLQGTLTGNYFGSPTGFVGMAGGGTLQVGAAGASLNLGGTGFTLSGGTLNGGSAGLTNMGILNITGASNLTLQGVLNNSGVVTQTTTLYVLFSGGTLNNLAGGTFDLQSGNLINSSGTNAFNNSGTVRKSTGTATVTVGVTFNNLGGSIDVRAGVLNLTAASASTDGAYNVAAGATLLYNGGSIAGQSIFNASGTLTLNASVAINGTGLLSGLPTGTASITGNLLGNTMNADLYGPRGTVQFNGNGTSSAPQLLEVMSADLGNAIAGLTHNFSYAGLSLANHTYVKLVDQADNATGAGPEALYVDALSVPSGTTLNLNGLHVYARSLLINGTIVGGTINLLPDSGPIVLEHATSGQISTSGQVDEWTFFDRGGDQATIVLNPGSSGVPAPFPPTLSFAQVQILDPQGNLLASSSDSTSGAILTLSKVALPIAGTYRVQVSATASHATSTGNYALTVGNATSDNAMLQLNQQQNGGIDSVFNEDHWSFSASANEQVQFDLLNVSSPGIQFELTGPNGFVGFTGVTARTDFVTLPTAGQYVVKAYGTSGQVGKYAFRLLETAQTNLALDTTYHGIFTGSGQAQLFHVVVPMSVPMRIVLNDSTSTDQTELYAKLGAPPSRSDFDYRFTSTAAADQQLLIPNAAAGNWYFLAYTALVPNPSSYTLNVSTSSVFLTKATPDHSGSNAPATLTLTGAGFDTHTAVQLIAADSTAYSASHVQLDSFSQITATFSLTGVPVGIYSVRVSEPGGGAYDLADAFTVVASGAAKLQTNLFVPGFLGRHATATIYVEYSNTGNVAMPAPLLVLESADPDGSDKPFFTLDQSQLAGNFWTSSGIPDGFSHTIQILASGATPGVLQPGESVRVPVYYGGLQYPWDFSDTAVELQLRTLAADDTTPLNWNSLKDSLRPPGINAETWGPLFANVVAQTGLTSGAYVQMLDDDAAYLGHLGETVLDVGQLWAFEIEQANGLSPLATLASAVDAAVVTPGLSLSFGRSFSESITGRYAMGPLGRGWSTPWQTSLTVDTDGSVTVLGANGASRRFQPDSRNGNYFAQAGDYGTLARGTGGTFTLREANGLVTAFRADGKLNYTADTNNNRITAGYSSGGLLTSLTHSSGASLTIGYNAAGLIQSVTSSDGRVAHYAYDAANQHLIAVQGYDGQTTSYTYSIGNGAQREHAMLSIAFPDGTHQFFTYDAEGRLATTAKDGGAETVTFGYDNAGLVTVTDAMNNTGELFFDNRGLLVKTQDPLGNAVYSTFDSNFHLTKVTDSTGLSQQFSYDSHGNMIRSVDQLGHATQFAYGAFGRLASLTDANGNTTKYARDPSGNLLSTTYANGSTERSTFDPLGDPLTFTNRNGQAVSFIYNAAGQVTRETFPDATHTDFTYDARGNLRTATDASGTIILSYDSGDRLIRVDYPNGQFLQFTLDAGGRRTQMVDQTGFTVNYRYDAAGRLSGLTDVSHNPIVTYSYDAAGRLVRKDNSNGTFTTYQYDADGNILHLVNNAPDASINSRFDYTYNVLGQRTTMATVDGTWTYSYDATGQLIHAVFASTNVNIPNQDLVYNYDALGNRTSTVINGVTTAYTSNNLNEYTTVGGAIQAYDMNGNLISDGVNTYAYDVLNRLISVTTPTGTTTFTYDALGNRSSSTTNGQVTQYLNDPSGLTNVAAMFNGTGSLIAHYTQGLGLTSRVDVNGASAYYDFDALGSTAGITGSAGTYQNHYGYLPFGETLASSETVFNPFQFVGQLGIMETGNGMALMRARVYGVSIGRFDSTDPVGISAGDIDLYKYAENDSVSKTDPSGLATMKSGPLKFAGVPDIYVPEPFGITGLYHQHVFFGSPQKMYIDGQWQSVDNVGFGPHGLFTFHDGDSTKDEYDTNLPINFDDKQMANIINDWSFEGQHYNVICQCQTAALTWVFRYAQIADIGIGTKASALVSRVANSGDPNEMTGPAGFGSPGYIAPFSVAPYRIDFENEPTATAPAQQVIITDPLDPNLDWRTFELTEIGFGDQIISIPAHSQYFQTAVEMTYNGETFQVQIEAGIDAATGKVFARFQSLDPTTSLPPDVLTGFLPPEDGTGRGKGYVSFVVSPKAGLATGTQIRNVALITFDDNPAIATDQVDPHDPSKGTDPNKEALNTIDSGAPTSTVQVLPSTTNSASFPVTWSGIDDAGGSGIGSFDIYVSDNGGAFTPWLTATTQTSANYPGLDGHTYGFFSVAVDNVGNFQPTPTAAETTTLVDATPPSSNVSALPAIQHSTSFTVTWSGTDSANGSGLASFTVFVSDNGGAYSPFVLQTTATSGMFTGQFGHTYALYSLAIDHVGNVEAVPTMPDAVTMLVSLVPPQVTAATLPIAENLANGTAIGFVAATNQNSGASLTFAITGGNTNNAFAINSTTGQITVNNSAALDFETTPSFQLTVAVTDQLSHLTGSATITVNLTDAPTLLVSSSIQHGATQRSFIRYIDLYFTDNGGLNRFLTGQGITLTRYDISGLHPMIVSLSGFISVSGVHVSIDFGPNGVSGNRLTNANDGTYRLAMDLAGTNNFNTVVQFTRLLGDVNGDGIVNAADVTLFTGDLQSNNLEGDVNGDGVVDSRDRLLIQAAQGRKIIHP